MKNSQNIARHLFAMTFALVGLMSTILPNGKAIATGGTREPIRNDRAPICSDSIDLDSDLLTSRDRLPVLLSQVESLKDL